MSGTVVGVSVSETSEKLDKKLKYLYPATEVGSGAWKACFNQYTNMIYTDVYMIPVALSGFLELVAQFTSWFAAPIFGTILDRFSFKKGKYWPWVLGGSLLMTVIYITLYTLPYTASNPSGLAVFIFFLAVIFAFSESITNTSMISCYPKLASNQADRTFLSSARQVGKNVAQSGFGYLVPVLVVAFSLSGQPDAAGWAKTAWIIAPFGLLFYIVFSMVLRKSQLEKNVLAQGNAGAGKKRMTMVAIFKNVFTNQPLLIIFLFFVLYQLLVFNQSMTASYLFRYYYQNFALTSVYQLVRTGCTAAGTFLGIFWRQIFKDTKRAFVAGGFGLILCLASLLFIVPLGAGAFIAETVIQNLFCGIIASLLLPLFAAAADYGTLKSGIRADGLNMSVYTLSIKVGIAASATFRAMVLAAAGYNARLYTGPNAVAPEESVLKALYNLQSFYPLILAVIAVTLVIFFYPITDTKLKEIKAELAKV